MSVRTDRVSLFKRVLKHRTGRAFSDFASLLCDSGKVPLAESKCEAKRRGRHGSAVQDHRGRHRGQPQKEIHGRLHICIPKPYFLHVVI